MDYTSLLGVWAVAVSGPCVISWLAGDLAGAARMRKLYDERDPGFDAQSADKAFDVEEWAVEGAVKPMAEPRAKARSPLSHGAQIEELAIQAERRREERQRALAPPPKREKPAAPSVLVTGECDAHEAQDVLARYRRSMEEMQRVNHAVDTGLSPYDLPFHETPSVRIAAPVRPKASARDLQEERLRYATNRDDEALAARGQRYPS